MDNAAALTATSRASKDPRRVRSERTLLQAASYWTRMLSKFVLQAFVLVMVTLEQLPLQPVAMVVT